MPKKRSSTESNADYQTDEGSGSLSQTEDYAKRARLDTPSDTTLQDLPNELLECILVKAVAMEVKGMQLARSVWKEKADPVMTRLGTVCSRWSSTLATDFFRNELHRALDGIAQETFRLEILHKSIFDSFVFNATTIKDDIFLFCGHYQDNAIS